MIDKNKGRLDDPEAIVTPSEAADYLGLHVKTVRSYIREGRIRAVLCGKRYRIKLKWVDEFMENESNQK